MARRKRKRYTDDDRANALAALAANGGNVKLTANQIDIPETTIRKWLSSEQHPEITKKGAQKKGPLSDYLEKIAWQLADSLPGKTDQSSLQQVATSLGIVIDKMRLLRNEPTEINRNEGGADDDLRKLTDEQLVERLAAARSRMEAARASEGSGNPGGD